MYNTPFLSILNSQIILFSGLPTTAKMAANSNLALILTPFINIYIYIIYQYIRPQRQKIDSNLRIYQGKKIFGNSSLHHYPYQLIIISSLNRGEISADCEGCLPRCSLAKKMRSLLWMPSSPPPLQVEGRRVKFARKCTANEGPARARDAEASR